MWANASSLCILLGIQQIHVSSYALNFSFRTHCKNNVLQVQFAAVICNLVMKPDMRRLHWSIWSIIMINDVAPLMTDVASCRKMRWKHTHSAVWLALIHMVHLIRLKPRLRTYHLVGNKQRTPLSQVTSSTTSNDSNVAMDELNIAMRP